jgi:hypothetical protein
MARLFFQAFVDYLLAEGRDLTLLDFREDFNQWLQEKLEKHEDKPSLEGLRSVALVSFRVICCLRSSYFITPWCWSGPLDDERAQ